MEKINNTNTYKIMEYDAFLRSQGIQKNKVSLFLGAGASIESGVLSASQCVLEWKKNIFDTQNPSSSFRNVNYKAENCIVEVQKWIDAQGIYPKLNSDNEYSFYAEKAYPDEKDRCSYFNSKFCDINAVSAGYKLLAFFVKQGYINKVWTTNFDDLVQKSMNEQNVSTVDVTLDCADRINYFVDSNCVMVVKLHGDYKYSIMKNTSKELDTQEDKFIEVLKQNSVDTDMLVMGYSGRDNSIMSVFEKTYDINGSGRLFWLGYEAEPNTKVANFLSTANKHGRRAYYVHCNGFDSVMLDIAEVKYGSINEKKIEYNALISHENQSFTKGYSFPTVTINKVISTNCYIVKCPQCFYQFLLLDNEKAEWGMLRKKIRQLNNVVAERYRDCIMFLGDQSEMQSLFERDLSISSVHFNNADTKQFKLFKLMTSAFLKSVASSNAGMETDGNYYLWDSSTKKTINSECCFYEGIEVKLSYCNKYPNHNLITILPKCYIITNNYDRVVTKRITDGFYSSVNKGYKCNQGVYEYLVKWHSLITKNEKNNVFYFSKNKEMVFFIGLKTALIGVMSNNNLSNDEIDNNRIISTAIENQDSKLSFYNKSKNQIVQDYHPMRGLIHNAPYEMMYAPNGILEDIKISIVLPKGEINKFSTFINELNYQHDISKNPYYLLPYPGFYDIYKIPLSIPSTNSGAWQEFSIPSNQSETGCKELANNIINAINIAQSNAPGSIVMIYIPKYLEYYENFTTNFEHFDLHDYIKAYSVSKGIPTQFVKEKTLEYDDITSVAWTLSLALYAKSGRTPWTINNLTEEQTAFVGIGYSVDTINSDNPIVLGCSHIFSADGQSIKYRLSKIRNPQFENNDKHRRNPFLTEEEAYRLGCNINDMFRKSFAIYPKRIVLHKRTPFKQCEIDGITKSFSLYGIANIDLLTITYEDNLRTFALNTKLSPDPYPVRRGVCFIEDERTMYLYTHGLVNPIKSNGKFVMGGTGIPVPLKITKHYGNGSALQIANDILGLTRMNWNNFNLYSKLPCTIESSNIIARIGYLLSSFEGAEYDYRLFI